MNGHVAIGTARSYRSGFLEAKSPTFQSPPAFLVSYTVSILQGPAQRRRQAKRQTPNLRSLSVRLSVCHFVRLADLVCSPVCPYTAEHGTQEAKLELESLPGAHTHAHNTHITNAAYLHLGTAKLVV